MIIYVECPRCFRNRYQRVRDPNDPNVIYENWVELMRLQQPRNTDIPSSSTD